MRWVFIALLAAHGLLHYSLPPGLWWGFGGILLIAAAMLAFRVEIWASVAAVAAMGSQVLVAQNWEETYWGTVPNIALILIAVGMLFWSGRWSLAARFEREQRPLTEGPLLGEDDLERVEPRLAHLLRVGGWVNRPRPSGFKAWFSGRIRGGPKTAWMPFEAWQFTSLEPPTRLWYMEAKMLGLPVAIYHKYGDGQASIDGRLLGIIPILRASGPEMVTSETVTFLNDACLLCPTALLSRPFSFEGDCVSLELFGNRVTADLDFDEEGHIRDFKSEDRLAGPQPDGSFVRQPWRTPVTGRFTLEEGMSVMDRGAAYWTAETGEYAYVEMQVLDFAPEPGVDDGT